jgi:hypothetical protein
MKSLFVLIIIYTFVQVVYQNTYSQDIKWKRSETDTTSVEELHLFHSTQGIDLPTAETLQEGNYEFEISHRFVPTTSTGRKYLWGLDGPVNMRLALGYGISDRLVLTLGRSNLYGNVDLWLKYNAIQIPNDILPIVAALRGGIAWNSNAPDRPGSDNKNFQYYGQIIINTLIQKKVGIGIVPSYLDNSYIFSADRQYSFTIGTDVVYYWTPLFHVIAEWNPTITGFRMASNPVSFGIELQTGGHFFKIILTNSTELNPSQFLAGTLQSVSNGNWHIGFNITRLLEF